MSTSQLAILLAISVLGTASSNYSVCTQPWHYIDIPTNSCQCYDNPRTQGIVRCTQQGAEVLIGFCMTVDNAGTTYVGSCLNNYPAINYENTTEAVYIVLPHNVSELNHYMCGGMHREGRVCGECEPGYGPAVHQAGFLCAKCEWYGVPVYLLLEFVPVTLFYIIILVFRISLTSAPMISFVIYCQMVTHVLTYDPSIVKAFIQHLGSAQAIIHIAATLGGIWNLDFLKFVTFIPPICVSEDIKNRHVIMLSYISALYPQLLIAITFACIKIYNSKYGHCLRWICQPIRSRAMINIRKGYDEKNTVADVFTTFLVLSYSKLVVVAFTTMAFTEIQTGDGSQSTRVMAFDTTIEFLSPTHFPIAAIGILVYLIFGIGPPLFLLLHPTGRITRGLQKCNLKRASAVVNHIAAKFQADYRDGREGGPNLTYLAGMYMVVASASYFVFLLDQISALLSWFGTAMWMVIAAIFILSVRPHKENYKNILSALILTLPALYCTLFVMYVYNIVHIRSPALDLPVWIMCLMFSAPQALFVTYIISKPVRKSKTCQSAWKRLHMLCTHPKRAIGGNEGPPEDIELPHRLEQPEEYQPHLLNRITSQDEDYPNEPQTIQSANPV